MVRLSIQDILALGLTIKLTIGDLPGHVVIPELNAKFLEENKKRVDEFAAKLAELAGRDIVLNPTG